MLLDISREELAQQESEVAMQLADYKSEHETEVWCWEALPHEGSGLDNT